MKCKYISITRTYTRKTPCHSFGASLVSRFLTVPKRHVYIFRGFQEIKFRVFRLISTSIGCLFFKLEMYCSDDTLYRPTYKSGQYGSASAYYTAHKTYDIAKRTTKGRGHSLAFSCFSEEVRPFKNTWISAVTISSMSLFIITAQAVYSLLSISIDVDHTLRYYFYECGHAVDSADFTRL